MEAWKHAQTETTSRHGHMYWFNLWELIVFFCQIKNGVEPSSVNYFKLFFRLAHNMRCDS